MAKRPIIQTIFKEETCIEALQEWTNNFLARHEAVNLQVCKNETGALQMMIVYKTEIEVEETKVATISEDGAKEGDGSVPCSQLRKETSEQEAPKT